MKRARSLAIRGWVVGLVYHLVMGGSYFEGWERLGRSLTEGALIALVPATLVFWVLWLPLRGFLARNWNLWRRRLPITLAAIVVFGFCGRLAGEFTTDPWLATFGSSVHFTVLYILVGLTSTAAQDPEVVISTADYGRPAFWISVLTACLAAIATGFSLIKLFSDEHNVTTGMSASAVGLIGLIVAVPFLLLSTTAAFLLWRARRRQR